MSNFQGRSYGQCINAIMEHILAFSILFLFLFYSFFFFFLVICNAIEKKCLQNLKKTVITVWLDFLVKESFLEKETQIEKKNPRIDGYKNQMTTFSYFLGQLLGCSLHLLTDDLSKSFEEQQMPKKLTTKRW